MENIESSQSTIVKDAIKFGVILSIISIIITLLIYAIDWTLFATLGFVLIVIALWIGLTIYSGINYRKSRGGYLAFGEAFLHCLIVLGIAGFLQMLFNLILYNVIDTELPQKLTEVISFQQQELFTKFGTPQSEIDEKLAKIPDQFTTIGLLIGYLKAYIGYGIISLIVALITRKNKPETV